MEEVGELPPDLVRLLFDLGPRKLVLLEGASDVAVFREWYRDRLDQVAFFSPQPPRGASGVQALFASVLARSVSPHPREYGIIDRDFRDEAEVEAALADPDAHLFILRRYCIENYLLEPAAVAEEVRVLSRPSTAPPSRQGMEDILLRMCRDLSTMMAAHWVFAEAGQGSYYAEGHDLVRREDILARVAVGLGRPEPEAEAALADKEGLIVPLLSDLDTAYQRISGKHLFFLVHKNYIKSGLDRDLFRNLLARAVKRESGLHDDIKTLIEGRVLGEA